MLYSFLNSDDLDAAIKDDQLTQLVRDDLGLVAVAEATAVSWMGDYLRQRFDLAATFPAIGEWAAGYDYGPAERVTVPAPAATPADYYTRDTPTTATGYLPLYAYNDAGRLTNYAWHQGRYYEALVPSLNVEPGTATGWQASWRVRDPRDPKLVSFALDIALFLLFKRVAPRRIPELRTALYNQAKEWLTLVRDGNLTPDLPRPVKAADSSDEIRWGSNVPRQQYY